jgi:hypothetical protein
MIVETGPPDDSYDNNVEYLIDTFPGFMENDSSSGNWKFLTPIGNQIDILESDIEDVSRATILQEAETLEQLDKHADAVGLNHKTGESVSHYRARIFAKYQLNTSEGTIGQLINSASRILNIRKESIEFQEEQAAATVSLLIPRKSLKQTNFSSSEIDTILNELIAAGYSVFTKTRGTFLYVNPSTYNNTTDWSTYDGYDGLDTNNDPKETGGTYAGIVN